MSFKAAHVLAFALVGLMLAPPEPLAQDSSMVEVERVEAFKLFHQGKMGQASERLLRLVPRVESAGNKVWLLRDVMEVCATAYQWDCVSRALNIAAPLLRSDPKLGILHPDFALYEMKMSWWLDDEDFLSLFDREGLFSVARPVPHASLFSELALTLHRYHLRKMNFKESERLSSSAILGLLLTDPKNTYSIAKVIIDLLEAKVEALDIVGAFTLASLTERFILKTVGIGSALHAKYRFTLGRLLSHTDRYGLTVENLQDASRVLEAIEMEDEAKRHELAIANGLATAALTLEGKSAEALAVHARHPMQVQKEAIIGRGAFLTFSEFFFAVSDVFLRAAGAQVPDERWAPLFGAEIPWKLSDQELRLMRSYQRYAFGLLKVAAGAQEEGQKLVVQAARDRIDSFELVLRENFEGFPLPSVVDKIVIISGLTIATRLGGPEAHELMLRGGEVLARNLRHELVETASLLAAQPNAQARREAHAFINMVARKREWETEQIKALVDGASGPPNKGNLIREYGQAVELIAGLKEKFTARRSLSAENLTVSRLQKSLSHGQVHISYFPVIGGFARFCVTPTEVLYSTGIVSRDDLLDIRLLSESVTKFPTTVEDARTFPFEASSRVYKVLFDGLDRCLTAGSSIIIAPAPEFGSVPFGALLRDWSPTRGATVDLRQIKWLVGELNFTVVISARHHLAASVQVGRGIAASPYLGVGDPVVTGDYAGKLVAANAIRGQQGVERSISSFSPLPETSEELRMAAKLFGARTTDVLVRKDGTEERFRSKPLGQYDVLHFATHGIVKGDVAGISEAALVLTPQDPNDKFDDGLLTAAEISRLSLNARLVVLSACNTAKFDINQAANGVQDLQAAFTVAGAPVLLASLWPVDSESTKRLIIEFMSEWRGARRGTAEALARATRTFIAEADELRRHPSFWAPFVVIGHGGLASGRQSLPDQDVPLAIDIVDAQSQAGGEVLGVSASGSDLILSLFGEWDGSKYNGIVIRRAPDGSEKWRVRSREIGAGRIAVHDTRIFAAGYTTSTPTVPVVRAFDLAGRLKWKTELTELKGYSLSDIVATSDGSPIAVAFPQAAGENSESKGVYVVALDKSGSPQRLVELGRFLRRFNPGIEARLLVASGRLIVAVNSGATLRSRTDVASFSGVPPICYEGAASNIYHLDLSELRLRSSWAIDNFRANSLTSVGAEIVVGGDELDGCSLGTTASLISLGMDGRQVRLWKDDDAFRTSVRGMQFVDNEFVVAVGHERSLGISAKVASISDGQVSKRWSEDVAANREASLVRLTRGGKVVFRSYVSGGLGVFVQGLVQTRRGAVAFGSMGGEPALMRSMRPEAKAGAKLSKGLSTQKKEVPPLKGMPGDWTPLVVPSK